MSEPLRLDPDTLKALAHPLRLQLFDALQLESATATQLAARFGQNTGTTSWHLRQLARYGLIEDDPDQGGARERWWRAAARSISLDVREPGFLDDTPTFEAARSYVGHRVDRQAANAHRFLATAEAHGERWIGATTFSDARLRLTVEEAEALRDELLEVLDRHRRDDRRGPGSQHAPAPGAAAGAEQPPEESPGEPPGEPPDPPGVRPVYATVHVFPLPDTGPEAPDRTAAPDRPEAPEEADGAA